MRFKAIAAIASLCFCLAVTANAMALQTFNGHGVVITKPTQAFLTESPGPAGQTRFDMWEVADGKTIRSYDVDMTKLIHMIVVSDDMTDFQHVHPALDRNGHLTIALHTAEKGLYHIYIDGLPTGIGRTVFRFDVPVGSAARDAARKLHTAGNVQQAGPYTVTIDPSRVPFGEIATVDVTIMKNGRPANDLHPYLGVMAHGVFIGTKDLAYMHAHGMSQEMLDMNSANDCGDSMMMQMTPMPDNLLIANTFEFEMLAPRAQNYNFWLQFIGGKTLYTVPFLVTTR